MKNLTIIIFIILTKTLVSQNNIPDFEFGQELGDELYCEFINDNTPFVDLTKNKYFFKRRDLKINSITVRHIGKSLDSIFSTDKAGFQYLISTGAYDHGYSYVEIYHFDKNGYTISKDRYPSSIHLLKSDTLNFNQRRLSSTKISDSLVVSQYFKDTLWSKTVYLKNIIYTTNKVPITIATFDSTTKVHSSKTLGYKFFPTTYFFTNDNKIARIKCENTERNYYDMTFKFPTNNSIIINCSMRSFPFDSIKNLENEIFKNSSGRILKSTFHYSGKPDDYSCYNFQYDKHDNLYKITRRSKAKDWFDYSENLYEFKHSYKNSKLIKTVAHYNFNVVYNDIIYLYNDKGLVNEIQIGDYKTQYEYSIDDN